LTNGVHGPLSAQSVYKIRYVLQQALIKRFRTWKAIMADRHIRNMPYRPARRNRSVAEMDARRELARARMAAPPVSHHKQPTGQATFDVNFERPAGGPNMAPQANTAIGRATLMGRGAGGGPPPPSPDVFLRAATQAYEGQPQQIDPSFELVNSTPTMKIYINTALKQVLVGVRGTKDAADVAADLQIPLYRLEYSNRYLTDLAVMRAV